MGRGRKQKPDYWSTTPGNALKKHRETVGASARVFAIAMGWGSDADIVLRYERHRFLPQHVVDQMMQVDTARMVGRVRIKEKLAELKELRERYGIV